MTILKPKLRRGERRRACSGRTKEVNADEKYTAFFCSWRSKERARTESRGIESRQRHAPICISFIDIHISSFSSTIIQPVIFSVNGKREHTPEVIRPVLNAGNHGSEEPKEPV
jgi:hypothetical protein